MRCGGIGETCSFKEVVRNLSVITAVEESDGRDSSAAVITLRFLTTSFNAHS